MSDTSGNWEEMAKKERESEIQIEGGFPCNNVPMAALPAGAGVSLSLTAGPPSEDDVRRLVSQKSRPNYSLPVFHMRR